MTIRMTVLGFGMAAALSLATVAPSRAAGAGDLPDVVTISAYDTGSSGHAQAVAIGAALKNELGKDLRILPGKNDISRMIPLRQGRVMFSSAGIAAFYAQEGIDIFAAAGGLNKAIVKNFRGITPDERGNIIIRITTTPESPDKNAKISGLEILKDSNGR